VLTRDPPRRKWSVVDKALDDWGKTARLAVLLLIMAACTFGPLALTAWLLMAHGYSTGEVCRAIGGLIGH
jgi:hypothetical protein